MKAKLALALALLGGSLFAADATPKPPAENMKLFLLIGQSNMAGRGIVEAADKVPHARVFVFNKERAWAPAIDPLHWDKDTAGVGLASTFGRVVADSNKDAVIGLIPAAVGGTSLDQWAIGGELYKNAVSRARDAMKNGKLVGILWHQGESDSGPDKPADKVESYTGRFAKMISQLREDLGAREVPVIVGELGYFRPDNASGKINEVLRKLPDYVHLCACVSAEGLNDKGDKLHFDSASLREFGRRYAKAWMEMKK